ncbi:MAG: MMPL family transporter [Candidatus Heimdallarchaeaceae archaeon]
MIVTDRVMGFYQRHHKKILIVWLIIALACSPGAYFITKESSKSELSFLPRTESWEGLELLSEKFPDHGKSSFIIVLDGTNITQSESTQKVVEEFTDYCNDTEKYPEIISVYSIYSILSDIQRLYNETLDEIVDYVATIAPDLVSDTYEELYELNNTLHQAIDMFQKVPYIYSTMWWNISRFVFYINNQTLAYQRGALNDTEINLLENWLQMDNESILQLFALTNNTGQLMYTVPILGDNITSLLTYSMLNSILNANYDESLYNVSYAESPLALFLGIFNNTFNDLLHTKYHLNGTAMLNSYYGVTNPTATDFAIGYNVSLATYQDILSLVPQAVELAGNSLLSLLAGSEPWLLELLSTAYNLRTIDYLHDNQYASAFLQMMTGFVMENIDSFIDLNSTFTQMDVNASELMTEQDILLFLSVLYNSPYPLDSGVQEFLANLIASNVQSYIENSYPAPSSISELDKDIYYTFVSQDNSSVLILISLNAETGNEKVAKYTTDFREFLKEKIDFYNVNLDFHITGDMALTYDILQVTHEDLGRIDMFTALFVFSFLLIIFMSPIAPFIPLIVIGLAIVVVYTILLGTLAIGYDFPTLMLSLTTVVMMGAGVDYCIFMIYRYIEERENNKTKTEATKSAFIHISETVLTSGLTVMVGFGSLLYTEITFINRLGFGPVIGIAVALALALSAIPSLLLLFGDKLFWPRFKKKLTSVKKRKSLTTLNEKIARWTVKYPWLVIILVLVAFAPFVYYGFNTSISYDLWDQLPSKADSVIGANMLEEKFSIGDLVPTEVVVNWPEPINLTETGIPTAEYLGVITQLVDRISSAQGVHQIKTVVQPAGFPLSAQQLLSPSYTDIAMIRQFLSNDNTTIRIEVLLDYSPYSTAAINTVEKIKNSLANATEEIPLLQEAYIVVTGGTAIYQDLDTMLADDTPIIIAICLSGVFVVLLFLLGSLLAPIILELTILLSALTSLGVSELLFNHVFNLPIMWFLPVMLFVILFGLGMDFDILLVSRVKEEVTAGKSNKEAVVSGVKHTASIITSAGTIMAGAFSALLLAKMTSLKVMGFTIAFAIILDATIVRIFLVPAIMTILGKWNWWPNLRVKFKHMAERVKEHHNHQHEAK